MFSRWWVLAGSVLAVGSVAAGSAPARAADEVAAEEAADGGEVEMVTVSARRREENAQDVPIPMATLSGEALERLGRFRLEQLNESLPSTNVRRQVCRAPSVSR